jgi:hypothetical protein
MPPFLMRLVPRFSRGAPAYGFLGSGNSIEYPMVTGWINHQQFNVCRLGANNDYARTTFELVDPATGRFYVQPTRKTSPLIGSQIDGNT